LINDQVARSNELTGLEVAKYLLSKLVRNQDSIERMTEALEYDEKLSSEVLDFFIDARWIRQNTNGTYIITSKGNRRIE
jgi:hypothetical protein